MFAKTVILILVTVLVRLLTVAQTCIQNTAGNIFTLFLHHCSPAIVLFMTCKCNVMINVFCEQNPCKSVTYKHSPSSSSAILQLKGMTLLHPSDHVLCCSCCIVDPKSRPIASVISPASFTSATWNAALYYVLL